MNILVTGGCSFSHLEGTNYGTWPNHLSRLLPNHAHLATGTGAVGNGYISRRIIYQVSELLKTTSPENILVGVMWSGPNRHDFFLEGVKFDRNIDGWHQNPAGFVADADPNWVIISHGWKNNFARAYYANLHSDVGHVIYTYEHILRVQWFLKLHGIPYFMSTYMSEVMHHEYNNHLDVQHLYNQIDLTQFLPVTGEYEWCLKESGFEFPNPHDRHPTAEQHQAFTNRVIMPFLQQKKYL